MKEPIVQLLSTNGDGTGTTDMAADYSDDPGAGATDFTITDPADRDLYISRLIVYLVDGVNIDADGFGTGAALTNGVVLSIKDSADAVLATLTPAPIKTNAQWGQLAYDVDLKSWGTGNEVIAARWTFTKFLTDTGGSTPLVLADGQKLAATVNDDLSGLVAFSITAEGASSADL